MAFGLCALLSGCLSLNYIEAMDKAERFDAKAQDGLILVGVARDRASGPPRGWDDVLLLTKQDPQTGRMVGDCFRWDHFLFRPDPRRIGEVTYLLFRAPIATYSIRDTRADLNRHFSIQPGVVNYLGDIAERPEHRLAEIRSNIDEARRFLSDYPGITADIQPVDLLPGGSGSLMVCGP